MTFLQAIKAFYTPEERIRRHLVKAQVVARSANYTVLPGVLREVIMNFEKGIEQDLDFPDYCGTPDHDNDLQGMYEYLSWAAQKSGWSSNRLHYIEILYKKAKYGQYAEKVLGD